MHLYHDSAGPRLDTAVAARLRRLDPNLAVTFCRYAIDPRSSLPLECCIEDPPPEIEARIERRGGSEFLLSPAFHLWIKDKERAGRYVLVRSYPAEVGFGYREVAALEEDVGRYMSAGEIVSTHRDLKDARAAKRGKASLELRKAVAKANMSRIQRFCGLGDKSRDRGERDAKIVSYAGQTNRGTRGQVSKDSRSDGWELPDRPEY